MSKKRNIAVRKCETKYLAFFDSDSFPANQDWLIYAIDCLKKDPKIYAVGGPDTSPPFETKSQKNVGLLKKSFLIMHSSTKKWLFLKYSSLTLIPLMIWFIVNFVSIYDSDYIEVVNFFKLFWISLWIKDIDVKI